MVSLRQPLTLTSVSQHMHMMSRHAFGVIRFDLQIVSHQGMAVHVSLLHIGEYHAAIGSICCYTLISLLDLVTSILLISFKKHRQTMPLSHTNPRIRQHLCLRPVTLSVNSHQRSHSQFLTR